MWVSLLLALVASFFVANCVAWYVQRSRNARIEAKGEELRRRRRGSSVRTPVTVLSGFLGSGKTTLLNHVLTSNGHGLRIVVVENEFGAVSIDHSLIASVVGDGGLLLLKNGCMCCSGDTSGSELERVLDKMLLLIDNDRFDYVVVETSGVADPAPIIQALFRSEVDGSRFYLDGFVTIVDARHIQRHLSDRGFRARVAEAEAQIAYADIVVVNKVDLVTPDEVDEIIAAVRCVNVTAVVKTATYGVVDVRELLGVRAADMSRVLSAQPDFLTVTRKANHTPGIHSVSLRARGDIDLDRFKAWTAEVITSHADDVFRVKGILSVAGYDARFVIHGVHEHVAGTFEAGLAQDEPRRCHFVIIGQSLNEPELRAGWASCFNDGDGRVTERHASCGSDCDSASVKSEERASTEAETEPRPELE